MSKLNRDSEKLETARHVTGVVYKYENNYLKLLFFTLNSRLNRNVVRNESFYYSILSTYCYIVPRTVHST